MLFVFLPVESVVSFSCFSFLIMTFRAQISTLNIRGFGSKAKQFSVFDFARNSRSDFILLQETLAATEVSIRNLTLQWSGPSFWSPALGKQGGVVVLVKENSCFEVLNWQKDSSGRIVSLLVKVDDALFNLVNIYAPTNPTERKDFFENLHEYFYPHCYYIIAGDFNCYESPNDKFGGNFTPYVDLKEFRTTHYLTDAWRHKHKRLAQCTWFNAAKTIGSRLDKFFVSTDLLTNPFSCEIYPCVFSDHDFVEFSVELANVNNHGPGIWRLNLDLLTDEVFCQNIVQIIRAHDSCRKFFPSLHEWWDFLKDSIKIAAINFSREKQRVLHYDKIRSVNHLVLAKRKLLNGDDSVRKVIDDLETNLKFVNLKQQKSHQIRSRAKWIEEGEKPSRFFLKLLRHRVQKNRVSCIFNSSGTEVTTQSDIEQAHFDFYSELYKNDPVDLEIQQAFLANLTEQLTTEQKKLCDEPLLRDEISNALFTLANNKTPGSDGLPKEFYIKFWDLLAPILLDLYNFSFEKGSFSPTMQKSITRLLYKKDDQRDLKNWRPISLLNVDYKICSKALALRLSKVLSTIIHPDQTCSVPGRSIFDNLLLLRDILDYVNVTNEPGILLNLDQEKAFDRVDRHFLLNTLSRFGFGETFCRWISLLYCGASMQVIVNGFLTESIPLLRGVRQGDPLSPLLYVLCMEVFAVNLRCDPLIEGFLVPGASGRRFQISQYADDCTCLVKNLFSLDRLFHLIHRYELATGAKLNRAKTEAMWLGAWKSCSLTPHGLKWVNKMKILGVWFGNMCVEPENWLPRLSKLETNLNLWKTRSLSMIGKTLIINILGASKFWFLAKVLPIPEWVVLRFKKLIFPFLWGSKIETVSRATLSAPLLEGGLGLIDIVTKSKALKLSTMVSTISRSHLSAFYLLKYFVGSQLARFRSDWAHLKDNSTPSAISPSPFYLCCLTILKHLITRISDIDSFPFTSKFCYKELLKDTVTKPIVPFQWSMGGGPGFDSDHLWPLLRETLSENSKTDLAWLITLRGLKVRESLHRWGYINSDSCAVCNRSETIAHCFLYCRRTRGVWRHFHHTLSALTVQDFVPNIPNVFFYALCRTASQAHGLARFVIQSIIFGIWVFRNKATFHNGRATSPAIVRYVRQDMITRLDIDLYRLPLAQFNALWRHPSFCDSDGCQVSPKF